MTSLQALRNIRALIRVVLAFFVLSIGVAVASPVVHPQAIEFVCSTAGITKAVVHTEDGAKELGATTMDCPLCVMAGAPPSVPQVLAPVVQPLGHAVQPIPSAVIAAATAAPLPARGPPAIS